MSDRCEKCGGSITPHPEARDEIVALAVEQQLHEMFIDGIIEQACALDEWGNVADIVLLADESAAGGSPTTTPGTSTDPDRDAWLAKYGDLRGFIDPGVEGAP